MSSIKRRQDGVLRASAVSNGSRMTQAPHTHSEVAETAAQRVSRHASLLSGQLRNLTASLFPPASQKMLRSFSSGEVAKFVGVSDGYLRQLSIDGLGPVPAIATGGRRSYTLAQVNELRAYLAEARPREATQFLPRRRPGEPLQVIAVANFKGGSAKNHDIALPVAVLGVARVSGAGDRSGSASFLVVYVRVSTRIRHRPK